MKRQHAVEIILTRPATCGELRRACRAVPFAANADRTRLMAVRRAKSPGRALRSLRHDLDRLLPIDVLTTHYPDHSGKVLLNLALPETTCSAIREAAAARRQKPADFLGRAVVAALERNEKARTRQLAGQLESLLVHHAPDEVLACTARALLRILHPASSHSYGADLSHTAP
ncbi:hypothetical protein QF032_003273 [Streptomyces achromogenes]|nr:hypothetical protein [Streptomyces achromogenes]